MPYLTSYIHLHAERGHDAVRLLAGALRLARTPAPRRPRVLPRLKVNSGARMIRAVFRSAEYNFPRVY